MLVITACGTSTTDKVNTNEDPVMDTTASMPADDSNVEEMVVADDTDMIADDTEETNDGPLIIEVEAYQFDYYPNPITIPAGQKVTIMLSSRDSGHSLSIPELGINIEAYPDQPGEQTFTVDEPGTYAFRCMIYCGSGHKGMEGTLIVE